MTIASYILVGFVVGTCTAFSGVGAGALMTPMLVLVMGVDANVAIGSDLLFNLGTKIVAVFTHLQQRRTIQWKMLLWLCAGGVPVEPSRACWSAPTCAITSTSRRSNTS